MFGILHRLKNNNYCNNKCNYKSQPVRNTSLNAIQQNTVIQRLKYVNGGTLQFRNYEINNFGKKLGHSGTPPNNFR